MHETAMKLSDLQVERFFHIFVGVSVEKTAQLSESTNSPERNDTSIRESYQFCLTAMATNTGVLVCLCEL